MYDKIFFYAKKRNRKKVLLLTNASSYYPNEVQYEYNRSKLKNLSSVWPHANANDFFIVSYYDNLISFASITYPHYRYTAL